MQKFNLNSYILVQITEYGWKHLLETVGQEYINHCIKPYYTFIDNTEYYKLQAHSVITLFGTAIFAVNPHPIEANILIPDYA